MKSDEQSHDGIPGYEPGGPKSHPAADGCNTIYQGLENYPLDRNLPQVVAHCVERFLIGNVV